MSEFEDVDPARTANLLGALSLVLHDRMTEAISEATGQRDTAATALSWVENFVAQPSVGQLHRVLGLTPSGAVRLIDRLEADDYLERRDGRDGRSTRVHLTSAGRKAARKGIAARGQVLDQALSVLGTEERQILDRLLSCLLVGQMRGPDALRFMCRLCDALACAHAEGRCPVRAAVRERFGAPPYIRQ